MVQISQRLTMQMRQSPQQVLLSSMLQLPPMSLEQRIRLELETNPLLELENELDEDQVLEEEQEERFDESEELKAADERKEEIDWDEILNDEEHFEPRIPKEKNPDLFERPEVAEETLTDYLMSQLHMAQLDPHDVLIGEYLIWNINSVGYLAGDLETIAENLQEEIDHVERVLEVIQHFDPAGIGARNLQECLLIQLMEEKPVYELAVEILRDHFEDFKNKRYEKLAKQLDVDMIDIKDAIDHITQLNPKPGEGYSVYSNNFIIPDLEVRYKEGEFKISMNDWNVPQLRINNEYRKMMLDRKHTSKETREYIKQRLESARWKINSIHHVVRPFASHGDHLDKQRDFFEKGPEYLKPMILKDIADEINMDISTVSRVTNGKYVQTEWGVFELKYFFREKIHSDEGEAVSNKMIKGLIKEIISKEPANRPYNDQR
jgi:RNA polymerase sigma-54 factor